MFSFLLYLSCSNGFDIKELVSFYSLTVWVLFLFVAPSFLQLDRYFQRKLLCNFWQVNLLEQMRETDLERHTIFNKNALFGFEYQTIDVMYI